MNPGKAMAQVHHAGVQMMSRLNNNQLLKDYIEQGINAGAMCFNTTITLAATKPQIESVMSRLDLLMSANFNIMGQMVIDPSYPFLVSREAWDWMHHIVPGIADISHEANNGMMLVTRSELTCAWFLGDRNIPEFKNLFDGLELHE
jgi:hypothetical protein